MRFRSFTLLGAIVLAASLAQAQKWCFVVAGDGRSDKKIVRPGDKNGINVEITKEICAAVLKERAKFLAWTGDLVYGYEKDPAVFESQLRDWVAIMKPLYDRGVPVLASRGNHDAGSTDADMVWRKVFSGKYALPQNGPAGEEGMTYYYGKGNVLMVALDQYGTVKETVNQPWLDKILGQYPKPFVFAFGHEPAFMDGAHKDTLDVDPVKRDAFWNSLINAGSRVYFAGHDHLYDHMIVTRAGADPGPEMHQIIAGTSGAPFYDAGVYAGKNEGWKLQRAKNFAYTYGYMLVEIDGDTATISFKGRVAPGEYNVMERFTIKGHSRH